jgi:hypothetical protein
MKNGILKFQIIPPKRDDSTEANDGNDSKEEHDDTGKEETDNEKPKAVKESM